MASHSKNCMPQQYPPNPPIPVKAQNTTEILPAQGPHPPPPRAIKNTKWTTFSYTSPQIRKITNLFKHTNVRIAYKCTNTISYLPNLPTKQRSPSLFDRSGIHKLTCMTCNKVYVGQTSRNLKQRYKEHARYIKNNNPNLHMPPILLTTNMNTAPKRKQWPS